MKNIRKTHFKVYLSRFISISIVVIIMLGCSPQKRMNRLIDKYPYLVESEMVEIHDTIIVESVKTDTFLTLENLLDTVYITEDRLKIKTIFRDNKIYIEGECETDTIFYTKEIEVEKVVYLEDTIWTDIKRKGKRWGWFLIVAVLFFVASRIAKKFI